MQEKRAGPTRAHRGGARRARGERLACPHRLNQAREDAISEGLRRASQTVRGITGLEVVAQKAKVVDRKVTEFRATMELTFVLE